MLSVRTMARSFRWASLALVVAAIGAPSAHAFFSEDDLTRMGLDCVRKELAAAGGTAASDLQPTAAGASESLDWGAAGIGAGIGVASGLCVVPRSCWQRSAAAALRTCDARDPIRHLALPLRGA